MSGFISKTETGRFQDLVVPFGLEERNDTGDRPKFCQGKYENK